MGLVVSGLDGSTDRLGGLLETEPATGKASGSGWALNGSVSHDINLFDHLFQASYGLTHVGISRKAMTETSSIEAGLDFQSFDESSTRADVRFGGKIEVAELNPTLHVGLSHEIGTRERKATATLSALPGAPFTVRLRPEERTWLDYEIYLPLLQRSGLEFALRSKGVLNDKTGGHHIGVSGRYVW